MRHASSKELVLKAAYLQEAYAICTSAVHWEDFMHWACVASYMRPCSYYSMISCGVDGASVD